MHTENQITIFAPAGRIFALGSAIVDWPQILPHYRFVNIHSDDGRVRQAEMGARRDWLPVWWRTSQVLLPDEHRILFFHTGGVTRGMYVEWTMKPIAIDGRSAVNVTISHDLSYALPLLTNWFARSVVGGYFVSYIAGLTLVRVKQIAEAETAERLEY